MNYGFNLWSHPSFIAFRKDVPAFVLLGRTGPPAFHFGRQGPPEADRLDFPPRRDKLLAQVAFHEKASAFTEALYHFVVPTRFIRFRRMDQRGPKGRKRSCGTFAVRSHLAVAKRLREGADGAWVHPPLWEIL